uniref:Uncharacterized protein n=1 Tax=Anguilla anguilla TaxID=7936 RepID=A0A0E9WNJ6_ANGAN
MYMDPRTFLKTGSTHILETLVKLFFKLFGAFLSSCIFKNMSLYIFSIGSGCFCVR